MEISTKTDLELIKEVNKNNNSLAFSELSNRHTRLFSYVTNKYIPVLNNSGIYKEDIQAEKDHILLRSIEKYNPKKGKFSSFFGNQARFFCLRQIQNSKNFFKESEDVLKYVAETVEDLFETREIANYIFDLLKTHQDARIIKVFKMRFAESNNLTFEKIGVKMGFSRQTIVNLYNKGLFLIKSDKKIKKMMDKHRM